MPKPKRILFVSIIIIILIAVVAVTLLMFYSRTVTDTLNEEVRGSLQEITSQETGVIQAQIRGDLHTLEAVATMLSQTDYTNMATEDVLQILSTVQRQNDFKRMGLIAPDGSATLTDGYRFDFSDREYFQTAVKGIPCVSDTFPDAVDGQNINVYAVPVYQGSDVVAVLFATNRTDVFEDLLSVSAFNGSGYSYIVQQDGTIVVHSHHKDSIDFQNLFDLNGYSISDVDHSFTVMQENMGHGLGGVAPYYKDGELYYLSYAPLGVNDWFILSIVPARVVSAKSDYLVSLTAWVSGIIVFTVVILLVYIALTQHKARKKLEQIAYTDELTGSPSWMKYREDCKQILHDHPELDFAIVDFDINQFKIFNQLFGYTSGNDLIRHIASVLKQDMGELEAYTHTSSDSFSVFIRYASDEATVARIIRWNERIREFPFAARRNYNLSLSYGIYKIPKGDYYLTQMSDRSKIAKNSIKHNVNLFYAFYDDRMNNVLLAEKEVENAMEAALKQHEFIAYYQPKFDLYAGTPIAAEALVRWNAPEKGLLSPAAFIPTLEKNGFIVKLDLYIFELVCQSLRKWLDEGVPVVPISTNFSRLNIYQNNFADQLTHIVQKYDVPRSLVEVELTESALTNDDELILRQMNALREAGFRISIDDFGTGYSSLNLLRSLPVDVIKLDKGFFTQELDNKREKTIISSILLMAEQLGISVVAEGVETREQLAFLKELGYHIMVQGYLFSRPVSEEDFLRLLEDFDPNANRS